MTKLTLQDGSETYDVTVLEAPNPFRVVLFAVGGGGNPDRHLPLLACLVESGCTVIAPHFERLKSPHVADHELLLRGRRLNLALDSIAPPELEVAGVGHSIGATMLLALAGGQVWMSSAQHLSIVSVRRLARLALLTPATGFFQAPNALDTVSTPILAWAGTNDTITPPGQAEFLKYALGARLPVEVRVVQDAGHFSFMNTPPPESIEPLPNREEFLSNLAEEVRRFVIS
jgi:predicted alpha/beta hydrolase family esterase